MRGGRDGDLTVFLHPSGGWGVDTLNFSCYIDLDQASTVYHPKISEVSDKPPIIIES